MKGQRKLVLCLGPDPLLQLLALPRKSGTQRAEGSPEPMTRWQEVGRYSLGDHHTTQSVSKPLLSFFLERWRKIRKLPPRQTCWTSKYLPQ